jgi:hypothetical protein
MGYERKNLNIAVEGACGMLPQLAVKISPASFKKPQYA